ncbi:FUSC family protein [Pseudomonas fulva]|uniref:Fusaric acid resistance protein conserved region n=1 Tax=Pseudomonas fulva (strain 12-X) TaxID=743720 RepID=F6A9V0_PSEF1|nr:FUSC family protein [Pseudomonas fulva]AEF22022.1 Fusaric acid resistance protein conserved region [Pseudomonas fulva 12-X]
MSGVLLQRTRQALAEARAPLLFSLHSTAAALLALALANAAGIHHPWWAAMTVWLVAQPTRGLFIERSIARLTGSLVGALVGGVLLYFFFGWPNLLLCLLALWLALCAAVGNFFRHFRNYAWVLAGYTAAIVALFGLADPVFDPELASGRVICTLLGILCCSCISWLFTAKAEPSVLLEERLDALVNDCLRWCMSGPVQTENATDLNRILGAIKTLDGVLDFAAAGSRKGRQRVRHAHEVIDALLVSVALVHSLHETHSTFLCDARFADERSEQENLEAFIGALQLHPSKYPQLLLALERLQQLFANPSSRANWRERVLNHDWRAASTSAARPLSALIIAALAWRLSGWSEGAIMTMTAVLFASLFSSHNDARMALKDVFIGSLLGASAGMVARLWLLPQVHSDWQLLACIAPFLLTGAALMARARTAKLAIDLNMTFLLTAQPGVQLPSDLPLVAQQTLAIVLGVLAAAASLLLWYPALAAGRRLALARRIARQTRRATAPSQFAAAHGRARALLRSLVVSDGYASVLVSAALRCIAATAPFVTDDSSPVPDSAQAAYNAEQAARTLARLTSKD